MRSFKIKNMDSRLPWKEPVLPRDPLSEQQELQGVTSMRFLWDGSLLFRTAPTAPLCFRWTPQLVPCTHSQGSHQPSHRGRPAMGQPRQGEVWNTGCSGQISVTLNFVLLIT